MEAIFWLGGIALSIFIVHSLGKKLGNYAGARLAGASIALFWLAWTLGLSTLVVGYALTGPLFVVQLLVIAIAFFYCRKYLDSLESKGDSIEGLEKEGEMLRNQVRGLLKEYQVTNRIHVTKVLRTPSEHRQQFLECLMDAQSRIIILSGWATDYAIDWEVRNLLKMALDRGVSVYIGYGYTKSGEKRPEKSYEAKARESLENLQMLCASKKTNGSIEVRYFPNHAKLLLCDSNYAIFGSFNWLSNKGRSQNEEISVAVEDGALINREAKTIIRQFGEN
jgi:phosphatidylserine/phosphatidylglycerophosphate/cardiolipin synthase-like enzyme